MGQATRRRPRRQPPPQSIDPGPWPRAEQVELFPTADPITARADDQSGIAFHQLAGELESTITPNPEGTP